MSGRVLVVGGSIAGLFAAIALRSRGWEVEVYERAGEALANRGAGIATHDGLYAAVERAGIALGDEMGVPSKGRILFDAAGAVVGRLDVPQLMTSWGLIYRFLRARVPDAHYHLGYAVADIEATAGGVALRFENGERVEGDWIVAADGSRSTVRTRVAPEDELHYCGYFIWRGLPDERSLPPASLADFDQRLALNLAPGGHWLGYLVAGPGDTLRPGDRWFNWAWYRSVDASGYRELLTDAGGVHYPNGIPHDRIRHHFVEAMHEEAEALLAPSVRSVIFATPRPFLQGIYELSSRRLLYDRIAIVGDAAFTARPHVGLGVSKAAEDATALADALGDRDAMAEWERERLAYGRAVAAWGRDLGAYCGPPPTDDARRAIAERHQRPEVLLAETAAIDPSKYLSRY